MNDPIWPQKSFVAKQTIEMTNIILALGFSHYFFFFFLVSNDAFLRLHNSKNSHQGKMVNVTSKGPGWSHELLASSAHPCSALGGHLQAGPPMSEQREREPVGPETWAGGSVTGPSGHRRPTLGAAPTGPGARRAPRTEYAPSSFLRLSSCDHTLHDA